LCGLIAALLWPMQACGDEGLLEYPLRQEIVREKGVLVSRPNPFDTQINFIIETNRIRNIDDYCRWLKRNILFRRDKFGDHWADPSETLKKRQGDCEDFAFLNRKVLADLGLKPRFWALVKEEGAHAICVFEKDGYYMWFDNADLRRKKAGSLASFARWLTQTYDVTQLEELDPQSKRWLIVYKRNGANQS